MKTSNLKNVLPVLYWALYDLANQFFILNIISFYFVQWLVIENKVPEILYGVTFGLSMFLVAVLGPFLGLITDKIDRHRIFLIYSTLLSVFFTMLLGFTKNWVVALIFFAIANFGCQIATVFYNALIIKVASPDVVGLVSGVGRMFSFLGAILCLYLVKPIVERYGYHASFLSSGFFFLIFSLPCMFFTKDQPTVQSTETSLHAADFKLMARVAWQEIIVVYDLPGIRPFLKSYFFSFCAINAVILFMTVFAKQVFNFDQTRLTHFIVLGTVFAVFGSILVGYASDRIGCRPSLTAVFSLWIFAFVSGAAVRESSFYYLIAMATGLALGSTFVVIRAMIPKLVPEAQIGGAFGLFNLVGALSSIAGPVFWGVLILLLKVLGEGSYRWSLLSLSGFMGLGMYYLYRIPPALLKEVNGKLKKVI